MGVTSKTLRAKLFYFKDFQEFSTKVTIFVILTGGVTPTCCRQVKKYGFFLTLVTL